MAVTVAVVEPRRTILWDDFSGRLEAVDRVELRPRVAGAILSTNFIEGTLVKAGDVLFKIDPAPYEAPGLPRLSMVLGHRPTGATATIHVGRRP